METPQERIQTVYQALKRVAIFGATSGITLLSITEMPSG